MLAKGFTLFELLVALALLAVLALLATPTFRTYLLNCRRNATVNAIVHAVRSARLLAGTSGRATELCPRGEFPDCVNTTDWSGTLMLRHQPASGVAEAEAPLRLVQLAAGRSGQSVHSNRTIIRLTPLLPAATTATVTVCDQRGPAAAAAVIVSRTGRPRISRVGASGKPLVCP